MTLADEHGGDVLIYHRDDTIYVDNRTGAPNTSWNCSMASAFDRHCMPEENAEWHQVPDQMDEIAMKHMAARAVPLLTGAGYRIAIDTVFGGTACQAARTATRLSTPSPAPATPPAAGSHHSRPSP
ncbi:hypothetical protein ACFWBX_11675 [Streptomyces sp. NPDC059991]|uniref:hypothetical protein n=1 Tax=Streptomyces sp. NPDC059991 TaxID=3347028 RepID=UPI0036BA8FBC